MKNSKSDQSSSTRWGYRIFLGLGFIVVLASGGALVLYLCLPSLGERFGREFLSRQLGTPVQLEVESISPWQTRINRFATGETPPGVSISLSGINILYQPEQLISPLQLEAVRVEDGILEFSLDPIFSKPALEADIPAKAPLSELPLRWPVQEWELAQFTLKLNYQGREWLAHLQGIGLEKDSHLEQALQISVPEWGFESDLLGNINLGNQNWNLNWESEVKHPENLLALVEQIPGVPALPETLTYTLESLRWEGQTRGRATEWQSMSSFFDTGPGSLAWEGGVLTLEGLGGAVLADAPALESTFGRLHLVVQSLDIESLLNTQKFAVEFHKTRNQKLLARVGPFSLRNQSSRLEGEILGEVNLTPEGLPDDLKLEIEGHSFRHRSGAVDLAGEGKTTLNLANGKAEARPVANLEWQITIPTGVYEPLFIESLASRGKIRELALPLTSVASLGSEWKALMETEWLSKLEREFRGVVELEANELSIPGKGSMKAAQVSVLRESSSETASPFQFSLKSGAASYQGFKVKTVHLEGAGNRDSGQLDLILEKPSGGAVKAALQYQRASPRRYSWKGSLPLVTLSNEDWLSGLLPALSGSRLQGKVGFSGDGTLDFPSTWSGSGLLALEEIDFDWPDQALTLSGLNTRIRLSGLNPITIPEFQQVSVDRIKKGDLEATHLRSRVAVKQNGTIRVAGFQGSLFQGTVKADTFEIDPRNHAFQVKLRLESIDLEKVIVLAKNFPGTMKGKVNGIIRVGWDGEELSFGQGYLEMVPGTEGRLELNLDRRDSSKDSDPYAFLNKLARQQTAVESLRSVRVESARFDLFNPDNPESPNQLGLQGVSLSLKPQTPVDITLNLREDVEESIRQLIEVFLSAK